MCFPFIPMVRKFRLLLFQEFQAQLWNAESLKKQVTMRVIGFFHNVFVKRNENPERRGVPNPRNRK